MTIHIDHLSRIAVLGAGTMGHGIAQVAAAAGFEVVVYDVAEAAVDAGIAKIQKNLDKGVARGKIDEALVGGKGGLHKELVLVAAEANGRVRLAHADNNDEAPLKQFSDGQIAACPRVVTDGHAGYNSKSLGERPHEMIVQTKSERRDRDALQGCHWTVSLLKRWLLGTHAGAVRDKHLQSYLDEFAFRHNRRKTNGVTRIAARVIENLVRYMPLPMRKIINQTRRCLWFASTQM